MEEATSTNNTIEEATSINSTNHKVIFTITLLTLLVAFSSYKDILTQTNINIFSRSFSIFELVGYITITLFFSVYISAIDNLKYSTIRPKNAKYFDICNIIADIFYLVAILVIPGFILTFYIISYISLIVKSFLSTASQLFPDSFISTLSIFYEKYMPLVISIIGSLIALVIIKKVADITIKKYPETLKQNNIVPVIVGILLLIGSFFVFNAHLDNQKTKEEINYHFDQANNSLNKGQIDKAIYEYNEILNISYNKFPYEYAKAENYLGTTYLALAEVRDKEINAQNAINAFQTALTVYTIEKYPVDYAMTQNNLGNAYNTMADVKDKEINAQNAINAYQNSLKVFTIENYPIVYATTQNDLGVAYNTLADDKDKEVNAQNAINAFQIALTVYTVEKYPVDYAMTQNNLGNAYNTLADVKDKEINAQNAINACRNALKVYTIERYPLAYALAQTNLGNAYNTLADVKDKEINAQNAINACRNALKVYTVEKYPIDYAMTQNNLGDAYLNLAEVRDKETNTQNAINAYQEAFTVYKDEKYPIQYKEIQQNLKKAEGFLI